MCTVVYFLIKLGIFIIVCWQWPDCISDEPLLYGEWAPTVSSPSETHGWGHWEFFARRSWAIRDNDRTYCWNGGKVNHDVGL